MSFMFSVCVCVGSCGRIQRGDFPLQSVGLENPSRPVFLPAIFHASDFPRGRFSGEIDGKVITGVSVCVVVEAAEVFGG